MILSPKENAKIYGPKKAKRPRPKTTFARWRKNAGCPPVFAQLRIGGQVGNNLLVSMKDAEAYAERAWNAGRLAARKEMPNKQPYYHQIDIRPTDLSEGDVLKAIETLVPKAQRGTIDIMLAGDDPQILFCAYSDRSMGAKRRLEKIGVQVYSADAEPGDPADLM